VFAAVERRQAQAGGQRVVGGLQVGNGMDQVIELRVLHGHRAWVAVRVRRCRAAPQG
jgi:hypothetical protein